MELEGYGCRVEYDGDTLLMEGTNRAARIALAGVDHAAGAVVLSRAEVERVDWKPASALANGRVTVHSTYGHRYVLHFRRKDRDAFSELATLLGATV